ncbi:MAG: cytochrome c family protein [Pseudomonadota bacterium]
MKSLVRSLTVVFCTAIGSADSIAQQGDAAAGKSVYKKCGACHFYNKEKNRVGPHLVGVVGRKAGVVEKYRYSKALLKMAEGGLVWDEASLDKFLEAPRVFIKRTKMAFAGLRQPKDRLDIIAFLKAEARAKE